MQSLLWLVVICLVFLLLRLIGLLFLNNLCVLVFFCHFVFVEDAILGVSGTDWDEHEEIEVRVLPEKMVLKWANECKIGHALAINALFFYQSYKSS